MFLRAFFSRENDISTLIDATYSVRIPFDLRHNSPLEATIHFQIKATECKITPQRQRQYPETRNSIIRKWRG